MNDAVPGKVEEVVGEAVRAVEAHPRHALEWFLRRRLYRAFGSFEQGKVRAARGWLAILAAQKVLPLFIERLPYHSLPLHLVAVAIDELSAYRDGTYVVTYDQTERGKDLLELSYGALGNELYEDEQARTFFAADLAATAADKALREARGWEDPFERLEHVYQGTGDHAGLMSFRTGTVSDDWVAAAGRGEETWVHLAAVGDTAGAAALAFAYRSSVVTCDPNKLRTFWLWWLTEALPKAWQLSQLGKGV